LNLPEAFAVQATDDHDDSVLSFGDDESESPKDLRKTTPLSTQPKFSPVQFDGRQSLAVCYKHKEAFQPRFQCQVSRTVRPRSRALVELEERFDMRDARFTPKIVSCLPDERPTVVYVASFAAAVHSLLSDKDFMKEENLSFPDAKNPFLLQTPAEPGRRAQRKPDLSELHHGTWHRATHVARCAGPKDVLAPVIGCMDGVATDAFGRLGLCPFNFTLGIFNAATRTRKEAWMTICYHPDDGAEASLHNKTPAASFDKCQNLPRGPHVVFAEFREITKNGGLHWDRLEYGGSVHEVNFKFALAFVVGDTEMLDKLCGKTLNRAATAHAATAMRHSWKASTMIVHVPFSKWLGLTEKTQPTMLINSKVFHITRG
jgi:hypothetical protein